MSYPIRKLISGQKVACINHKETVKDALVKMVSQDYSQLPIVDEKGRLMGVISEQTIVRRYFMSEGIPLFDLSVTHCMTKAVTLTPEDEVFDALGRLQDVLAVMIVEDEKPVGIVTYYDTTHFFRGVSEGLMYVEDIEMRLREIINRVCVTESQMTAALYKALGPDRRDPTKPSKSFDELTFNDYIQLITSKETWPLFEATVVHNSLFREYMRKVRDIRNQLAHFRDDLTTLQKRILIESREWIFGLTLPERSPAQAENDETLEEDESIVEEIPPTVENLEGKYAPLTKWLLQRPKTEKVAECTFESLEELVTGTLPESARKHTQWWVNDPDGHVQARAWLQAGWLVDSVELLDEKVHFRRSREALYSLFHHDVLERLQRRRPTLLHHRTPWGYRWFHISTDVPGIDFGWSFSSRGSFRVEIIIATGSTQRNTEIYDQFYHQRKTIEEKLGDGLEWVRETNKGTSTIYYPVVGRIDASPQQLEELKAQTADLTVKFTDVFMPIVQTLNL